ncbi:hypothetical protein TNCV_1570591 [Trichonephila clavipes]|uniref:Uncharacterized protein n=1 Tax=Trichonephila clavipes TaxID=2585209 RepID=A0A8X6VNQ6_TRICX|nr:hypothetical protein TNCV_1570591 [Trichonephila clavipes]
MGGRGNLVVKVTDSWLAYHEFESNAGDDPPCRKGHCALNLSRFKRPPFGVVLNRSSVIPGLDRYNPNHEFATLTIRLPRPFLIRIVPSNSFFQWETSSRPIGRRALPPSDGIFYLSIFVTPNFPPFHPHCEISLADWSDESATKIFGRIDGHPARRGFLLALLQLNDFSPWYSST